MDPTLIILWALILGQVALVVLYWGTARVANAQARWLQSSDKLNDLRNDELRERLDEQARVIALLMIARLHQPQDTTNLKEGLRSMKLLTPRFLIDEEGNICIWWQSDGKPAQVDTGPN